MSRGLRAIAARRHVAPATTPVLRLVLEDTRAPRVCALSHARQLALDECIGRAFHDGNEEARERISHGDEASREGPVGLQLDTARPGTAAEYAIDVSERVGADVVRDGAPFGEKPKRGPNAPCVTEDGQRAPRLLCRAAAHAAGALGIEESHGFEPADEVLEIMQRIMSDSEVVGVHEVEPEAFSDKRRRRRAHACCVLRIRRRYLEGPCHAPSISIVAGRSNRCSPHFVRTPNFPGESRAEHADGHGPTAPRRSIDRLPPSGPNECCTRCPRRSRSAR